MNKIKKLDTVAQFNAQRGQETLHELVSVLDQSKSQPITVQRYLSELFIVFLKKTKCSRLLYGRGQYDYQDSSLIFIGPGQVMGLEDTAKTLQPNGWVLVFHPDLIKGTALGRQIKNYRFFSYDVAEALHLSASEQSTVLDCFNKILSELANPIDHHSRALIVSNIELFLVYCERFYARQFNSRAPLQKDVLVKFEQILDGYYQSDKPQESGIPTVHYCASKLHYSANYFGDLIKRETGKTAREFIQDWLIDIAKDKVLDTRLSINQIAYQLGFKYPQHFTRFFKLRVGQSPSDYRFS